MEGIKPVAFTFQESHLGDFELEGSVFAFSGDKAIPSAGTKNAALPASICSPWMFHVQPTQAQDVLPGDTLIPVLVLRLL